MRSLFVFLAFLLSLSLYCQQNEQQNNYIENLLETAIENNDRNAELTSITEELNELLRKPLNLNTATLEELERLPFLTLFQAKSIIAYREEYGTFLDISELKLVYGFDEKLLEEIKPYVTIDDKTLFSMQQNQNSRHFLTVRTKSLIEKQEGYRNKDSSVNSANQYLGNRLKIAINYKICINKNITAGLKAEKDPGEEFFGNTNKKGFDFYSGFVLMENIKFIKTMIIGDYRVNTGQGLLMWPGFAIGKSNMVLNMSRNAKTLRPYTSFDENAMLRGIASTLRFHPFEFTFFVSHKKIDANIVSDSMGKPLHFTSFQTTGLHNTRSTLEDKDALIENLAGADLSYKHKNFKTGVTFTGIRFNIPFVPSDRIYNRLEQTGNLFVYASMYYRIYLKNTTCFGEMAYQFNHSTANTHGVIFTPASPLSFGLLYRYFSPRYKSFYSNAFGENTVNTNEEGFYLSLAFTPLKALNLSCYYDLFRFPWLKYQVDAPSFGNDFLMDAVYTSVQNLSVSLRFKVKNKTINTSPDSSAIYVVELNETIKKQIRLQIEYALNENFLLRNRAEWLLLNSGRTNENAFIMYQDIRYQFSDLPLKITGRAAIFDSPSFYSAIYTYENDMPGEYSVIPYYDKGFRNYLMITWFLSKKMQIWLRYSQTRYESRITRSGLNSTGRNTMSEIKAQLQIIF